jgi:hypothetical protein
MGASGEHSESDSADLTWQVPSVQKLSTYVRTTRAPSCWAPHKRSHISASFGSLVWRGLLELASIRARFGVFTPTKRYSVHSDPVACRALR